jgi:hypothetical protein
MMIYIGFSSIVLKKVVLDLPIGILGLEMD